jgi:PIN domain nuclease of toxin-antitoxin system
VNIAGAVLLDTCALIWLANGDRMAPSATRAIIQAGLDGGIFVSPVSAWEIGMLSRPRANRGGALVFLPDPKTWFTRLLARPGLRLVDLSPEIAIDASLLPEPLHADPTDRLLIATARHLGTPIVTRDSKIADYAAAGHVAVLPC